jgi:diguanylate cyclase (GGDEF)-like protein/PAS domain S-box-containing protein
MTNLVRDEADYMSQDTEVLDQIVSILLVDDTAGSNSLTKILNESSLKVSIDLIDSKNDFDQLNENKTWQLALVSLNVPELRFDNIMSRLGRSDTDMPVILVSDSIDDTSVSEALRYGVKDFVSKGQLSRLVPAITRELIDQHALKVVTRARLLHERLENLVNLVRTLPESLECFEDLNIGICKALFNSDLLEVDSVLLHFFESDTVRHTGIVGDDTETYKLGFEAPVDLKKLLAGGEPVGDSGMFLTKGKLAAFDESRFSAENYLVLPLSSLRRDSEGSFLLLSFEKLAHYSALPEKAYIEISRLVNNVVTLFSSRVRQLRLERAVEMSPMSILMTDIDGSIAYVNQALVDKRGYARSEILGNKPSMFNSGATSAVVYKNLWQTISAGQQWKGELQNRHKDGQLLLEKVSIFPVRNDFGTVINYVGICEDISDLKRHKSRLDYMTSHDSVTGLINLQLFSDRVSQSITQCKQFNQGLSLVTLSIVNFKIYNEQLGFNKSNIILKMIADQVKSGLKPEESLARGNGAELVLLLPGIACQKSLEQRFKVLIRPFSQPMNYLNHVLNIQFFAGGSIYMDHLETVDQCLASCHGSLYEAKNNDLRDQVIFGKTYIEGLDVSKSELVTKLDDAITNDELELYYQVQVNAQTGLVRGCEALVRWNSPDFGLLSPDTFIPVAEASDQIIDLGNVVLKKSIEQVASWGDLLSKDFVMSINLSSKQLREDRLLPQLEELIRIHDISPSRLEFEITESSIIESLEGTLLVLQKLRTLGCTVSIDDFGTGYSNLSYLRQMPLDVLKIDKCFIDRMTQVEEDALLSKMIIQLAQTMDLKVVAEGVETEAQSSMLKKLRCDYLQGYLYSKPIPADEFENILRSPTWHFHKDDQQDTLLIIDDERHIISALRRLFKRTHMKVLTTTDPYEAMDIMAEHQVGVIISDQRMPEMLGTELLRKVKKIHPDTIRIMLSGYTDVETLSKAVNEGAIYKFIHKPWDDVDLLEEVDKAFKVYHGQQRVAVKPQ